MGKISTYPTDTNVTLSDRLIGTDNENNNETKNFTVGALAGVINDPTVLTDFVPYTGATNDVDLGANTIESAGLILNGPLTEPVGGDGALNQILTSQGAGLPPKWLPPAAVADTYKGSFYDSLTQTLTGGPNVAIPVILRSTDTSATNGISVVTDGTNLTRITVAHTGVYNLLFSAQLTNSGGSNQTVDFWLRKNGSTAAANVDDTNGKVYLQSNTNYVMAAWNYFIALNAGDYIYLMWTATSTNVSMINAPSNGVHPDTPSIIVTLNEV